MYRAMIVDDEEWVVKNLVNSVEWSSFGFEIIGTETHSPEALEQIKSINPDLVLVDIRMPEISGLELIKRCNELNLETLFIVVSGFAEFSYVQKCMNLGAVGYCLKPIEEEEITPLLKRAKDILDERSVKDIVSVLDWIMEDTAWGKERIGKLLGDSGFNANNGKRVAVFLEVENTELLRPYRHIKISTSSGKSISIIEENNTISIYDHLHRFSGKFKGIGLSRLIRQDEDLKAAVEEAELAAYQYFISGKPTVYQATGNKGYSDFKQLSPALQRQDMSELAKLYDQYAQMFTTGEYQIKHAFFLYNTVMTTIIQSQNPETEKLDNYLLIDFERLIERYHDVYDLIQDLKRMTTAFLGGMYLHGQIRSDAFLAVLQYVNSNYHQNLSLQMLGDEFYMNRNYISQLFIKHVSQSFTDYLAGLRVRHACELLTNSNLPIHRVGERVGYPDAYYFSKIFKKIVGRTPREYRTSRARE
jgi:two-component system, response regulator YesN